MTDSEADVKRLSRRIACWIDAHPRTGWYAAGWAFLISLNAIVGYLDLLLHALS